MVQNKLLYLTCVANYGDFQEPPQHNPQDKAKKIPNSLDKQDEEEVPKPPNKRTNNGIYMVLCVL